MIVLDTTVLVYAVGGDHPLAAPARAVIAALEEGRLRATTTVEAVQEFVHVRARRRERAEAAALGRDYAVLLAPLMTPESADLDAGLALFEALDPLGCFDAVLAATALRRGARALVSADAAFGTVPNLPFVALSSTTLQDLLDPSPAG